MRENPIANIAPHSKKLNDKINFIATGVGMEIDRFLILKKTEETGEIYRFITNNFTLSAEQVALIYKNRWQIELFFKWIKQNLKIKSFLGTSRNAVLSQIWVAMIFFLLMCYIKFQTRFKGSLLELTRMIRETLMIRRQIIDLRSLNTKTLKRLKPPDFPQMSLWV